MTNMSDPNYELLAQKIDHLTETIHQSIKLQATRIEANAKSIAKIDKLLINKDGKSGIVNRVRDRELHDESHELLTDKIQKQIAKLELEIKRLQQPEKFWDRFARIKDVLFIVALSYVFSIKESRDVILSNLGALIQGLGLF